MDRPGALTRRCRDAVPSGDATQIAASPTSKYVRPSRPYLVRVPYEDERSRFGRVRRCGVRRPIGARVLRSDLLVRRRCRKMNTADAGAWTRTEQPQGSVSRGRCRRRPRRDPRCLRRALPFFPFLCGCPHAAAPSPRHQHHDAPPHMACDPWQWEGGGTYHGDGVRATAERGVRARALLRAACALEPAATRTAATAMRRGKSPHVLPQLHAPPSSRMTAGAGDVPVAGGGAARSRSCKGLETAHVVASPPRCRVQRRDAADVRLLQCAPSMHCVVPSFSTILVMSFLRASLRPHVSPVFQSGGD